MPVQNCMFGRTCSLYYKTNYAYMSEAPFGCSTLGQAVALPINIGLGWKSLPGRNTFPYYKNS
jgi:hypothetical protein